MKIDKLAINWQNFARVRLCFCNTVYLGLTLLIFDFSNFASICVVEWMLTKTLIRRFT